MKNSTAQVMVAIVGIILLLLMIIRISTVEEKGTVEVRYIAGQQ